MSMSCIGRTRKSGRGIKSSPGFFCHLAVNTTVCNTIFSTMLFKLFQWRVRSRILLVTGMGSSSRIHGIRRSTCSAASLRTRCIISMSDSFIFLVPYSDPGNCRADKRAPSSHIAPVDGHLPHSWNFKCLAITSHPAHGRIS